MATNPWFNDCKSPIRPKERNSLSASKFHFTFEIHENLNNSQFSILNLIKDYYGNTHTDYELRAPQVQERPFKCQQPMIPLAAAEPAEP